MNKFYILFVFVLMLAAISCSAVNNFLQPAAATPAIQLTSTLAPTVAPTATADLQQLVNRLVATALAAQVQPTVTVAQPTVIATTPSATTATMVSVSGWEINAIDLKDDPIVAAWLPQVKAPAPLLWPTFPNVPNPLVPEFRVVNGNQVPDGVEYGEDDSPFCEYEQTCDWVVPAWHYRLISGDYKFTSPKFSYSCRNVGGQPRKGCLIVLFNVMNESYTWRDQSVDNGFTVMGRYWNGDQLQWAVWGLTSHAAANMLNLPTMRDPTTSNVLNAGGNSANAGANCGVQPDACGTVDVMVVIHAGDRILATMHTTVNK